MTTNQPQFNINLAINIIIGITVFILLTLFIIKHIALPLRGDDWGYGSILSFQSLFSIQKGIHPGRQVSELLHIVPDQIFTKYLSLIFDNPLLVVRVINNSISIIFIFFLYG